MARTAIEDRYYELHPKSAELYERAKLNFPKGVTHEARNMTPFPVHMDRGLGSRKWDVDGNEYVEYNTGHGSMILGQANPAIVKAVQDRMALGTHLSASSDLEIRWADLPGTAAIRRASVAQSDSSAQLRRVPSGQLLVELKGLPGEWESVAARHRLEIGERATVQLIVRRSADRH